MPAITFATVPGISTYRVYRSQGQPPSTAATLIAEIEVAPEVSSVRFVDAPHPQPGVTYFGPPINEAEGRLFCESPRPLGNNTWEWGFGFSNFQYYRYGVQTVRGRSASAVVEVDTDPVVETTTANVYRQHNGVWEPLASNQPSPAHFTLPPPRFPAPKLVGLDRLITPAVGVLRFECESVFAYETPLRLVIGTQILDSTLRQTLIPAGFLLRRGWYRIPSATGQDGETVKLLKSTERQVIFPLLAQSQILALYPLAPEPGEPLVVVVEETTAAIIPPTRFMALRLW